MKSRCIQAGLLILLGALGYAIALPQAVIGGIGFDVHTLLFASLFIIAGYQALLFAVHAKVFAVTAGLLPADHRVERAFQLVNLERGLVGGAVVLLAGLALLAVPLVTWWRRDFGALDYQVTMRWAIPGVTFTAIGLQTVLASFFFSILGLARRS